MPDHCRSCGALPALYIYIKKSLALQLSLAGNSCRLTWARLQQPQEQRYPFLTLHAVFSCVQTKVWLPVLGIFNVRRMLMHANAPGGSKDTERESALKVDWEKISLAAPETRTYLSGVPVRRSSNIPALMFVV